jgi:hypothetical protein
VGTTGAVTAIAPGVAHVMIHHLDRQARVGVKVVKED